MCVSETDSRRAEKHCHNLYIYTEDNFGIPGWVEALGEAFKAGDFIFVNEKIIQVNPNARLVKVSSQKEFREAVMEFALGTGNRIDLLNVTSHSVPTQLIMNFDPPKALRGRPINYVDISDFEILKEQGIGIKRTHFSGCSTAGYVELPFINIVQAVSELFQAVSTGYTTGTASSLISGFEYKEGEYVRVRMEDGEFVYDPEGYILQYLFADELIEYSNGEIVSRRTRGKRRWHEQLEE